MITEPLRPHPTLDRYYATDQDRPEFVSDIFDKGAASYEWVCRAMSLGTGAQYRKQALRNAGLEQGDESVGRRDGDRARPATSR